MAVSQIEEKILGRLARQTEPSNALLSASFYQVLGISIQLSRRLFKARKLRRLDTTRDTKSLQLYHHIIWLAREGLSITEANILPLCQNGEQGPECRVMAAKLCASLYHIFCLFHNHPPVGQFSAQSPESKNSPSTVLSPKAGNGQTRPSPRNSPYKGKENSGSGRRAGKAKLRDPIPSITSDASYVTNPYAHGPPQTPPPAGLPPPVPPEARKTPTHPPGLARVKIPEAQAAASFLLPPLNFVPLARERFDIAQHLADSLLAPAHALRLSISLEHAAFLWDCEREVRGARHLARKTIRSVYASTEGLDDDEFADASTLVQAMGGIVRRGTNEPTPQPSKEQIVSPNQRISRAPPPIDRTIAVSPANKQNKQSKTQSSPQTTPFIRSQERLSTVAEVESTAEASGEGRSRSATSPPTSRLSSRSKQRRSTSSVASDKASKRRVAQQAEDAYNRTNGTRSRSNASGSSHSRQPTPQEGYVPKPKRRSSRNGGNG